MEEKEQHMSTAVVSTGTVQSYGTRSSSSDSTGIVALVPSAQPRLRITKRGRVVFTSLAAIPFVVAAVLMGLNGGGATATSSAGAPVEQVTVQAGQSLWQLAEDIAPGTDPREVIRDILAVNQLESASVQAGQRLDVPAEYSE
jgi:LysM repeat protein